MSTHKEVVKQDSVRTSKPGNEPVQQNKDHNRGVVVQDDEQYQKMKHGDPNRSEITGGALPNKGKNKEDEPKVSPAKLPVQLDGQGHPVLDPNDPNNHVVK